MQIPAAPGTATGFAPVSLVGPPRSSVAGRKKLILIGAGAGGVLLLGLLIFILVRAFAGGAGLTNELHYLPDDCRLVVSINVQGLLDSNAGQKFLASAAYRDLNKQLGEREGKDFEAMIEEATGIPARQFIRVTVGYTFGGRGDDVMIIYKARDARRFRAKIRTYKFDPATGKGTPGWAEFEEETVGKHAMKKHRDMAYCVVDSETILMGPVATLRTVLRRDKAGELAPGLRETMSQVDFSQAVAGAVSLKGLRGQEREWYDREIRRELNHKLPGLADSVEAVHGQARVGSQIDLEGTLLCRDAGGAANVTEQLNGFLRDVHRKAGREEDVPQELLKILASIRFTASGSRVTASVRIDPDEVTRAVERAMERDRQRRERWRKEDEMWRKKQQEKGMPDGGKGFK
jgi:hypothetical protein